MSSSRPLPSREDYWSEGETSVLIDEWGDRFMEFNRGSLRQGQWQEIADAVNSRPCDARRPPRTDLQCRNRVDTLKKKYKIERNKCRASDWIFFKRMDFLLGPISARKLPLPFSLPLPTSEPVVDDTDLYYSNGVGCDDSDSSGEILYRKRCRVNVAMKESEGVGVDELAKTIGKMVEVYEKVEMEKSRQMMELEKERMEFLKSIEIQRMNMVVDMLVSAKKMMDLKWSNFVGF